MQRLMATWQLVLCRNGMPSQDAIPMLNGLHRIVATAVSFSENTRSGVVLLSGVASTDASPEPTLLKVVARSAPALFDVVLGDLDTRLTPDGLTEFVVQVRPSEALSAFVNSAAGKLGGQSPQLCILLGRTGPTVAERVLQRLRSWWSNGGIGKLMSFNALQLFDTSEQASSSDKKMLVLGEEAALQRGRAMFAAHAAPSGVASSKRASSLEKRTPCGYPGVRRASSVGCHRPSDASTTNASGLARARHVAFDDCSWAIGLHLSSEHPALLYRPPTRFHFVLDNSGSMGHQTESARTCFSELVTVANGPCSLTVFSELATTLGEAFTSPAAMRAVALPRQGQTNISDGVTKALDIVSRCEATDAGRTHHVLVLLSDGAHNRGPTPEATLPKLGKELLSTHPSLRLSVVVVGVTSNSNTSMGMLLKQSLETVALPALDPIYFASTPKDMGEVLQQMHRGLATLRGGLVNVSVVDGALGADGCGFVKVVGEAPEKQLNVLAAAEQTFLCVGKAPPKVLLVDGDFVQCSAEAFDSELASTALENLMDGVRLRRIAKGADEVKVALQQLNTWTSALEARLREESKKSGGHGFCLAGAGPSGRVAQHKAAIRTLHGARELRNQLADIEALRANDSASQAAFLTGARSKYGAKALRRAADRSSGAGVEEQFQALVADVSQISPAMRLALRKDLCAKLHRLDATARGDLEKKLSLGKVQPEVISKLIYGSDGHGVTVEDVASDMQLVKMVDGGVLAQHLLSNAEKSYISLQTPFEQLREWCDAASDASSVCRTEYELLMYLGSLGHPIEVQRRAATQMDPFAMQVTRVRAAPADTASLCCALRSEQAVVPPEGGVAIEDLLVLVNPDLPHASKIVACSKLVGEVYTSVVLCRDLNMYSGRSMQIALHAHTLLSAVQPASPQVSKKDLEAQLRRQYLGRAYQCPQCSFGPIDHFACGDLEAHHGEDTGGAEINNACPSCGWFSAELRDWNKWDGTVPESALKIGDGSNGSFSEAMINLALRVCYSSRALWRPDAMGEAHTLCGKLAKAGEPLTRADEVQHPVQLLLALATCDEVAGSAMQTSAVLAFLNEVCARKARDTMRAKVGTDENDVSKEGRRLTSAFLGVTAASAPEAMPVEEAEPPQAAVKEACSSDFELNREAFDFMAWVEEAVQPYMGALLFIRRLRAALEARGGGWPKLEQDMEFGPAAYADVVEALGAPVAPKALDLCSWFEVDQKELPRVVAAIAGQAFLHSSSSQRRLAAVGGSLAEPLPDVREEEALGALAVELRMAVYGERVVAKVQEWRRVGVDMTVARARVADLGQYTAMCGSHVHGLSKQSFWGLWRAAKRAGDDGAKVREFLRSANHGFVQKFG